MHVFHVKQYSLPSFESLCVIPAINNSVSAIAHNPNSQQTKLNHENISIRPEGFKISQNTQSSRSYKKRSNVEPENGL